MIYIGGDKHGLEAIRLIAAYLKAHSIAYTNVGAVDGDMPLETLIPAVTSEVLKDPAHVGILVCGTGVGVEVGANKFSGIRACLANDAKVAGYARVYDDCNVLCLVGWEAEKSKIESILDAWLGATFDGSEKRKAMFSMFDSWGGR